MFRRVLISLVAAASLPSCAKLLRRSLLDEKEAPLVFVIADPQVHNVTGGFLRQEALIADRFAGVARRRPELNILAPYLFEDALARGLAAGPDLTLVLGDVSDVACVQEHEAVTGIVEAHADGGLVLFAHGNHDTYLMGTVNSYGPPPELERPSPGGPRPSAASWWKYDPEVATGYSDKAWPSACLGPDGKLDDHHYPMNKGAWISRTIDWLARYDVAISSTRIDEAKAPRYALRGNNGKIFVEGEWSPMDMQDRAASYLSYLVQLVEFPTYRLVIIDTSVCETATGGIPFLFNNAGNHGCIGENQIASIKRLLGKNSGQPVIFAGHFDLAQVIPCDRAALLRLMREWGGTYLSAHTHSEANERKWGQLVEFNVGSTTDWPMEAALFSIKEGRPVPAAIISPIDHETNYVRSSIGEVDEYCRHVEAAVQLATLGEPPFPTTWKSPRAADCDSSKRAVLGEALERIAKRATTDSAYREYVLSVAKGASYSDRSFFLKRIP